MPHVESYPLGEKSHQTNDLRCIYKAVTRELLPAPPRIASKNKDAVNAKASMGIERGTGGNTASRESRPLFFKMVSSA